LKEEELPGSPPKFSAMGLLLAAYLALTLSAMAAALALAENKSAEPEVVSDMKLFGSSTPLEKPALDLELPASFETATFALG
jgi:hypothetical protein